MSDRQKGPASQALQVWAKDVNRQLLDLQQRPSGSPNGLIVPGGAAGTWAPMILSNSWTALSGSFTPAYVMDADGFVVLRGLLAHATSWPTNLIWTPPAGYAPRAEEFFPAATSGVTIGSSIIDAHPTNGVALNAPGPAWSAGGWISLSGIRYYAGGQ